MTSRGRLGEGVHVDCTHMSGDTSRGAVRGLYREPGLLTEPAELCTALTPSLAQGTTH